MQCDKSKYYTIQLVCIKQANRLLHKLIWLWKVFYFGQRCWSPPPVSQAPDPWFWKKNSRVRVSGNRRRAAITSWGYCFSIIKAEPSSSYNAKSWCLAASRLVCVLQHHWSCEKPENVASKIQRRFASNCYAWDGRQNNNRMMGWKRRMKRQRAEWQLVRLVFSFSDWTSIDKCPLLCSLCVRKGNTSPPTSISEPDGQSFLFVVFSKSW